MTPEERQAILDRINEPIAGLDDEAAKARPSLSDGALALMFVVPCTIAFITGYAASHYQSAKGEWLSGELWGLVISSVAFVVLSFLMFAGTIRWVRSQPDN